MSEAWKAGGCRAPGGRAAQFAGEFAAVRARSSRVVRASSRTLFARCVICCSRAVRALFVRCSRVVRTLFALVVRTFNFKLGWLVACEFAPVVCTLFARCSCAVRALFARCSCAVCASANSPANYAMHPSAARHTRCLPHAWPQSHSHSHRRLVHHGGAHKHHGQHCGRPWLASPGSGQAMWGCCFGVEGGGARAGWGHSISPCRAAAAAACRRRAPAKGRRAARGQRCRLWLKRWPSGSLWWCRSVMYQQSPRTGGCTTIWLAPSQPAASGSHQAGQRGAGRHLSATWLLSAGIVRHSTTGLACVNRRSTEPTPGSVITVLPPHGAPLLLLAEGRGQRKGGRHRGTARRAADDANRAPHEVEAGSLFD